MVLLLVLQISHAYMFAVVDQHSRSNFGAISLPSVIGPESIAFDSSGGGPYSGVSDGRVLKWEGRKRGWVEFAVPPRCIGVTRTECDGTRNTSTEDKCGRPLGLRFRKATGDLYIADAYYGLTKVGRKGGVAVPVATSAEGVPFNFVNGVDVDQATGMVYFTDSSTRYRRREWLWSIMMEDATGRFMSYNPRTKQVKVLLRKLLFPNGVALSKDADFALIVETTRQRIIRYWLKGHRTGTSEVFGNVTNFPDNIKRNARGEFWVAVNSGMHGGGDGLESAGKDDEMYKTLGDNTIGMRFREDGAFLEALNAMTNTDSISEIEERNGRLWLGSAVLPSVGVYTRMTQHLNV